MRHGKLKKLPNVFHLENIAKELYHFTFLPLMCMSPTCSMSAVRMFCRTQDPLFTKYILYIDESIFKA